MLRIEDVPEPEPGDGEILVRVTACALNFPELLQIKGGYQVRLPLPHVPGSEIAGVRVDTGERVLAVALGGGLAEIAAVPLDRCLPIPTGLDDARAAAMPINYLTGYHALADRAALQPGETVLVHAAAGGVGSAAAQIAKAMGARVIATAGGPEKVSIVRDRVGVDVAIDYSSEDLREAVLAATGGRGVDVVYDPVGADVFDISRRLVAFGGRYLVIGFTGGRIPEVAVNHVLMKGYSVVGVHWGHAAKLDPTATPRVWKEITALTASGHIDPLVMRQAPFEEAVQAFDDLAARRTWGKVVVRPPAP